jgi:hypothetical protein
MGLGQPVVNQPCSALVHEPRPQELVAVLPIEQLSRYCRQPSGGVLGSGDVMGMGSIEGLHHLDAKACIVREKDCKTGHC